MKFTLEIELGSDEMCTKCDLGDAVRRVANDVAAIADHPAREVGPTDNFFTVCDLKGNRVGHWRIAPSLPDPVGEVGPQVADSVGSCGSRGPTPIPYAGAIFPFAGQGGTKDVRVTVEPVDLPQSRPTPTGPCLVTVGMLDGVEVRVTLEVLLVSNSPEVRP